MVPVSPSPRLRIWIRSPFTARVWELYHGYFAITRWYHHPRAINSETRDAIALRRAPVTPQDDWRFVLQARTGTFLLYLPTAKAVMVPSRATPVSFANSIPSVTAAQARTL